MQNVHALALAALLPLMQERGAQLISADSSHEGEEGKRDGGSLHDAPGAAQQAGNEDDDGREVWHGLGRLEFETNNARIATRLGLEGSAGQALDLELALVWRVLVPLRNSSGLDSQQCGQGAGGPGVVNCGLSFHG